jgi:acyl-CoA synthetase (NDP forming)
VPLAGEVAVTSAGEAAAAAGEVGLPAVAKVSLPEFPHRSNVGLVRTGLRSAGEVVSAFEALSRRAEELAPGSGAPVLVQRQVEGGVEMLVGVTRDASLGPALLVGMGGVLAEIIRDVSVRPLPITRADAEEMVSDLRGAAVLDGARGAPPVDRAALVDVLLAVAAVAGDPSRRVTALDLNPVIVTPTGAVAVDWLVEVEA